MSLSHTLSALSDPNRRAIIISLKPGELAVSEIAKHLPVTLATLSHHLKILKQADLISSRRSGQQILYSLNLSVIDEITATIINFLKL